MSARQTAQSGFSLIEAMIVLAISSLILSVTLELSGRATARNAALAERVGDGARAAFDEQIFRTLLRAATPKLQQQGEQPPATAIIGGPASLSVWVSLERPVACAGTRPYQEVRLEITRNRAGYALQCTGDLGSYPLAQWARGSAVFAYSAEGSAWQDEWPNAEDGFMTASEFMQREENRENLSIDALQSELIKPMPAPLVRVSFPARGRETVWIERAGDVRRRPSARPELFIDDETRYEDIEG